MFRKLAYVLVAVICRVVERDSDYFIVQRTVVQHGDHSDRVAFHKRKRVYWFGAKHQYIQRVAVLCIGAGDKAVVGRVVRRGVQNSVQQQETSFLVKFIFHFAALLNFNYCVKVLLCNAVGGNVVPDVHSYLSFQKQDF